jgi:exoribonuclease-2
MAHNGFDLAAAARREMVEAGFEPDFPADVQQQLAGLLNRTAPQAAGGVTDLRNLPWSSIDNDSSRDLDQAEVAGRESGGIRIRVAIADVDVDVPAGSPIDLHACKETTTVYTGVKTFPMLPEQLSTDLTSLNENADRLAVVIDMVVADTGEISSPSVYRALVRNQAQLTYNGVGPWLEGKAAAPPKVAAASEFETQLKLQDQAAQALRAARYRLGALDIDRVETEAMVSGGEVHDIAVRRRNRASELIEDFMIAANETMARTLAAAGVPSIRRIVKSPERWPRIVELAARYGDALPATPDSAALNRFLQNRKQADETHYADVSLAVIKLMGPGEYVVTRPGDPDPGHFALAAHDYTHSTAPNRRFADLATQRLIKATLAKEAPPYSYDQLASIASNCTLREDAARKVERAMNKRMAAVAFQHRIGESFDAVVTGATPKGVFVRVLDPPVEGRLMRGEHGIDVGDRVRVKLAATDPERGYIDFTR